MSLHPVDEQVGVVVHTTPRSIRHRRLAAVTVGVGAFSMLLLVGAFLLLT